jgi:hypothetical protein
MPKGDSKIVIDVKGYLMRQELDGNGKRSLTDVSKAQNTSRPAILNWSIEAPQAVRFLYNFMKETGCKFEDLVKEIKQ